MKRLAVSQPFAGSWRRAYISTNFASSKRQRIATVAKASPKQISDAKSLLINREHLLQAYSIARLAIKYCFWEYFVYVLKEMVASVAGHSTDVALNLAFLGDLKFTASVTLAGAACGWAVLERYLRLRKVAYMQGRIQSLEKSIDPNRTSSRLTTKGTTNPEDSD